MKSLRICGWAVVFTVTFLLAACAPQRAGVADTNMTSGPDTSISQSDEQTLTLERQMNALVIQQAWLDEHELQLTKREEELSRRENALAINQAWLNERETRLTQKVPDLTKQEDMFAFRDAWLTQGGTRVGREASSTDVVKLAGTGSVRAVTSKPEVIVEDGRCYASIFIPAQYRTVAVTKPIETPKGESLPILYQTVTEQVKIADEQTRMEEILCAAEKTECRVVEIQRALFRGGYNPGPIDGVVGKQTMAAVNAFQKDFNLTVANQLTVETVKALDANF